ncbi:60S acidic ribosomal protein P2-like [Myzus persicae]|uniref:60S acidic ribosomal protein P2-like n=1 Tax=Myzus persicae TaxID=13164 RepID=UPI000B93474D|nr:60S acidic ribosomal protein P2-like [Myzus persicae]
MRYVAAYLLASFSGKEPTSDEIEKILSSVGIESDSAKVSLIVKELKGKNVDEVIESGRSKLASVPTGAAVAAPAGAASAAPAAEEKASKKEEKKEESDNESDDDMGFGLFN